jgi:tetratricopeptide (TPR) repeat protein
MSAACPLCGGALPFPDAPLCEACAGKIDATQALQNLEHPEPAKTRRPLRGMIAGFVGACAVVASVIVWIAHQDRVRQQRLFQEIQDLEPSDPMKASERYSQILKQDPECSQAKAGLHRLEERSLELCSRAEALEKSDPPQAKRLFDQAVQNDPNNPRAQEGLKRLESAESKANQLAQDARKILTIENPEFQRCLNESLAAEKLLDQAIQTAWWSPDAHYWRGVVMGRRGRFEAAHAAFDRAAGVDALVWKEQILLTQILLLRLDAETFPKLSRELLDRLSRMTVPGQTAMSDVISLTALGKFGQAADRLDAFGGPAAMKELVVAMRIVLRYLSDRTRLTWGDWQESFSKCQSCVPGGSDAEIWVVLIQHLERSNAGSRLLQMVIQKNPIHSGLLRMGDRSRLASAIQSNPDYLQARLLRAQNAADWEAAWKLAQSMNLSAETLKEIQSFKPR